MINLIRPNITDYPDKAPVPAGGGFSYNLLPSDRRFEELLYTISKQKIINEESWNAQFDDVFLTAASGDSGADCILYKEGKARGVIQCKKYAKNLDRLEVLKEILKFVLYTIVDNSLMPDPTNFRYFFAVSKGFSKQSVVLLNDFAEEVHKNGNIADLFAELKKKYPTTLRYLDFSVIKEEFFSKLKAIKINKITPEDLDIDLNKPYNKDVCRLFFEIRSVVENSVVEKGLDVILASVNEIPKKIYEVHLTDDEILQKFQTASIQLKDWKATLSNTNESHIKRIETQKILTWLNAPLAKEKDPILMLVGNPGLGKSVILRDAMELLLEENIPVIGIKADRYYTETIDKFNEATNLKYPLEQLLDQLLKKHDKVVVLIDQIDSLSSTVTSKRIYLDVYRQLINNILSLTKEKPDFLKNKIRLVIAIREFDLTYDFEFNYFKKFEKVKVDKLTEAELENILVKLNLKISNLSIPLTDLLRTPAYLEIFCKIYNESINLSSVNTEMKLMNELWNQEITNNKEYDASILRLALYNIVEKLYIVNQLSVETSDLNLINLKVLEHLKNKGLIFISGKQTQFFHQTFYDYVFARFFVEKEKSLEEYIFNENQSIYIRATLKIMIAFYRQTNFNKYIALIKKILFSSKYRFHIQLLVIHELGFLQNPREEEVYLVTKKLLKKRLFFLPFLESAVGVKWFPILCERKILDQLIFYIPPKKPSICNLLFYRKKKRSLKNESELYKGLWSSSLRRALKDNEEAAIDYLYNLRRFDGDSQTILWILLVLKNWIYPISLKVFEKYIGDIKVDWYSRMIIISDAVDSNYDWSIKQLKIVLNQAPELMEKQRESAFEHHLGDICEKLEKNDREKFFDFAIKVLEKNISEKIKQNSVYQSSEFYLRDTIYNSYDFRVNIETHEENKFISLIFHSALQLSKDKSEAFKRFIDSHEKTRYLTLVIILVTCYAETPEVYKDHSYETIKNFLIKDPENYELQYHICNLLTKCFLHFADWQKQEIFDIILKIKPKFKELGIDNINGKKTRYSFLGHLEFKYLSCIPIEEIKKRTIVKRRFQELSRLHKPYKNNPPSRSLLQRVGPPLNDNAYKFLDFNAWLKTMYQFSPSYTKDIFQDFKGGIVQHSRKFGEVVENNPELYYPFIENLLTSENVADDYITEALAALEKIKFDPDRFLILYKLATKKLKTDFGKMRLMWLANYLHDNQLVDTEIFKFFLFQYHDSFSAAQKTTLDTNENDSLDRLRGYAVSEVIKCYYKKEFEKEIFELVLVSASDPVKSVRISTLNYLAFLMHLNQEKTLEIFLKFINIDMDEEVYKFSLNTAQYLARYKFKALVSYFKKGLNFEDDLESTAIILAVAWLRNNEDSYKLLEEVWQKSDKAKSKMIDVAAQNFMAAGEIARHKCFELLTMFLENDSKEVVQEYNGAFLHDFKPEDFKHYYEFIKLYCKSKSAKKEPHYYFDFLIQCSKQYPKECIDLVECYDDYEKPNSVTGPFYEGSEPVKIVVGALNGLYEAENKDAFYINKAMDLFDEMLKNTVFRGGALDVLNKI